MPEEKAGGDNVFKARKFRQKKWATMACEEKSILTEGFDFEAF